MGKKTLPPVQPEYEKCWVVGDVEIGPDGSAYINIRCKSCPKDKAVIRRVLYCSVFISSGGYRCKSCANRENSTTHGMSRTPEYQAWIGAKRRAESDPLYIEKGRTFDYENFGTFEDFYEVLKSRPEEKSSIDRIDNSMGYVMIELSDGTLVPNIRWADWFEQANNRDTNRIIEVRGVEMTVAEAARQYQVGYPALLARIHAGQSGDEAIDGLMKFRDTIPLLTVAQQARISYSALWNRIQSGMTREEGIEDVRRTMSEPTLKEIAKREGVPYSSLWKRIQRGEPLEEAVKAARRTVFEPTLKEIAAQAGISYVALWTRMKRGESQEAAIQSLQEKRSQQQGTII